MTDGGGVSIGFRWLAHGEGLELPARQTAGAAGVDLAAALPLDDEITIAPGERALLPCGFAIALPQGYEAQIRPRSGLAAKFGVTVLNSPGTIDCDYRGEIKVVLINHGHDPFPVRRGDRIAQLVVAPVSLPQFRLEAELDETERGIGGYGSTGHRTRG
ncbi:MAG: deoxyuridine 5-triphosphatenucleotidohydrolase [Devosia sp.]|nr:deoxyuridine 5-triphosphatenucleotidohydrolase [Devosia sp.]